MIISLLLIHWNLTILCKICILHFIQILFVIVAIFAYYAGIMLNPFVTLLCSKLCWHNRLKSIRCTVNNYMSPKISCMYKTRSFISIVWMNYFYVNDLDFKLSLHVVTIWCKILEGKSFGKMVHIKNWLIIFWWMSKISKAPKIIIMCWLLPVNRNHRVLLWCVVKMKHLSYRNNLASWLGVAILGLVIGYSHWDRVKLGRGWGWEFLDKQLIQLR